MTSKAKLAEIAAHVQRVFPKEPPPPAKDLTGHRCEECDQLQADFSGKKWWEINGELVEENSGQLPLFTPIAYYYFLPAYILNALSKFNDDGFVLEYLIYSWGYSSDPHSVEYYAERRAVLNDEQREVVREVLRTVLADEELSIHHEDAKRALNFYSEG